MTNPADIDPIDSAPENPAANGALDIAAEVLNEHKGKLAIGVAATLGLMVFYSWREKQLAKEDPEAHAMHQRAKAILKAAEAETQPARPAPPARERIKSEGDAGTP